MRGGRNAGKRVMTMAAIGGIGASLAVAASASAAGIVVDSTADPTGATDECTLRQAIESANTDTVPVDSDCVEGDGDDTITFAIPSPPPHTIALYNGPEDPDELGISSDLEIQGPGVDDLIVDATAAPSTRSRVFNVTAGDVTISGLTATGGHLGLPGPGPDGGGGILVDFDAALTLDDAAVVDNSSSIFFNGGSNSAATFGGGIYNEGDLTVTDTTVSGNDLSADMIGANDSLSQTTSIADGAAIYLGGAGDVSIARSAITGNTSTATATPAAMGPGATTNTETQGAIFAGGGLTSASVTGSTIANNTMDAGAATGLFFERAGGIFSDAAMTVTSNTITGNSAAESANLFGSTFTLMNTIIAEPMGGGSNCEFFGSTTSAGHNWADDASCDPIAGDVMITNPAILLPLGDNGGPTQTRRPAVPNGVDQTVIDQGVAASETLDQRGFQRTWNFDIAQPTGGDGTDVGAFEVQGPTFTGSNPSSPGDSMGTSLFGISEKSSSVQVFTGGACEAPFGSPEPDTVFADPGKTVGPFAPNSATTFSATTLYGNAISECSDPFTWQRRPALPTLDSTNPPSGGNNNNLSLIGTATASSTVNIYTQPGCAGSIAATGTGADLAGAGIPVTVADNSTTSFYAQATGVGGTSNCSAALTYSEVTPAPPTPPAATTTAPPAAIPTPTAKKCKKGFKLKKVKGKKKCVRTKKK